MIEGMKLEACVVLSKSFPPAEDQTPLRNGETCREGNGLHQADGGEYQFGKMIGKSDAMREQFELIRRIADTATNVLITGESGTGKELVAKAIHDHSPRKNRSYIPVNAAAIPEALLESELFGHVRGAFTDAKSDRDGLFEQAEGGTLLLDEISEFPLSLQAKLLRVLQDKEVRRVGSDQFVKLDVRVIAASNLDLEEEVKQRRFRGDLFYRLNVIHIRLPPLRERRDDILLLAHHFLSAYRRDTESPVTGISESAVSLLMRHPWPGNIRELENAVARAVILARGDQIMPEDLPSSVTGGQDDYDTLNTALDRSLTLDELEREYITRVLGRTCGNKARTAQILGIDRKTLYRKLCCFKATIPRHPSEADARTPRGRDDYSCAAAPSLPQPFEY